jgi:serine/threonine protein kinase
VEGNVVTLEEIFLAAVEKAPADRAVYLDAACGSEAELRAQVEALLRSHEEAGSLLEQPLFRPSPTVDEPPAAEQPGVSVGPYKLLQQIGEGGMGTVWMAQQTEPVKRLVAVKLIKAGMDSKQVIVRFEAERQALALMDHANIARVLDGGTTSAGRPYFVMDLVKGVPITRYCDEHHLTPRQRLELFLPVCQAIQHAHQKGIIHRDIKPSNVLVALYDDKPVPKVIDFGVAKAAGQSLTDKTLVTGFGTIVGTLEYMSPEQAQINQLDIDTRSDIYALGVLLYELLAGSPPFSRKELERAGMLEMLRVIREQEPSKPSTKLSTAEGLPTLAANRGTEPAKLTKLVRGELDWIVMKALEKDRNRRYETANGFAADVQRYLADEPVQACPPSRTYRLKKFLRRNKGPVLAASLVLLALVGGIIGTTLGLRRAVDEASKAAEERDRANDAREAERTQRVLTEAARDRAAATLDAMTSSVGGESLMQQKALTPEQQQFLITALNYYREVLKEHIHDESTRKRLAAAAFRVGEIENRLGRRQQAAAVLRQARDLYTQLTAQFPTVLDYREARANCHLELGISLVELGIWDEAEAEYAAALAILEQLAAEFPKVPKYRMELANSHADKGTRLMRMRKWDQAAAEWRAAIDLEKQLAADFPKDPSYAINLANSCSGLAYMLMMMQQWEQAEIEYRAALDILRKLLVEFPGHRQGRQNLAQTHAHLGTLLLQVRKLHQADTELRQALALGRELLTEFPGRIGYVEGVGATLYNLGVVAAFQGRPNDALAWFDQAVATLSPVVEREPGAASLREVLRNSHTQWAETLDRLKRFDEAAKHWEPALQLSQGSDRTYSHCRLMISRVHAGHLELAMQDAEAQAKIGVANVVYDCACVYALAHAKTKDDRLAVRAVELLRQAVAKGYGDVAHLRQDADLDSLRARDDYRKLLAELETKPKPSGAKP